MKLWYTTDQILDFVKGTDTYRKSYREVPDQKPFELQVVRMNTGDVYVWACENYSKPHSKSFARYDCITKQWTQRNNRFVKIFND